MDERLLLATLGHKRAQPICPLGQVDPHGMLVVKVKVELNFMRAC